MVSTPLNEHAFLLLSFINYYFCHYLQAKSASETVEHIRTSVLVTLEQNVQILLDAVLGTQGLQTKLASVEKAVRNGSLSGTVS